MWDLVAAVVLLFVVLPAAVAVWDEWRWMRYRKHRARWHDLILTSRRGGCE